MGQPQRCHATAPPIHAHRQQPFRAPLLAATRPRPRLRPGEPSRAQRSARPHISDPPRPDHEAGPTEELGEQHKSGCGCGASKAAPHGWMGAAPRRACGLQPRAVAVAAAPRVASNTSKRRRAKKQSATTTSGSAPKRSTPSARRVRRTRVPPRSSVTERTATSLCSAVGRASRVASRMLSPSTSNPTRVTGRAAGPTAARARRTATRSRRVARDTTAFLNKSECDAHQAELNYVAGLIAKEKNEDCKTKLKAHEDLTKKQRKAFSC